MALKGINAYKKGTLKQDIANADPHRLTLMLMQGALDKMATAKGCIERKDYEHKAEHITKATAIIVNLRDTLDMEAGGDFSEKLYALYDYMVERLLDANVKNDATIITEVMELFAPIKDAWLQIPESAKQEAYEIKRAQQQAV
jgi:flagellar protein FliS